MGYDKSINKKPETWSHFFKSWIPSRPASYACLSVSQLGWGYGRWYIFVIIYIHIYLFVVLLEKGKKY